MARMTARRGLWREGGPGATGILLRRRVPCDFFPRVTRPRFGQNAFCLTRLYMNRLKWGARPGWVVIEGFIEFMMIKLFN